MPGSAEKAARRDRPGRLPAQGATWGAADALGPRSYRHAAQPSRAGGCTNRASIAKLTPLPRDLPAAAFFRGAFTAGRAAATWLALAALEARAFIWMAISAALR